MANRRELKKDIRYLTEVLIIDALEATEILEKEDDKKIVLDIIVATAELHNELIARVNCNVGKHDKKLTKQHFRLIIKELLEGCSTQYEKLSALVPA